MRTLRTLALRVIGALVAASPLLAHHAWPVDRTRETTIVGTVTAYTWADPHVMIALDVEANGTIEKWKVGGSNKRYMGDGGWDKNSLKAGDVITAVVFRFVDGSNMGQLQKIVMASGKEMFYGGDGVRNGCLETIANNSQCLGAAGCRMVSTQETPYASISDVHRDGHLTVGHGRGGTEQ